MKQFPPGYQISTLEDEDWFEKDPNQLENQQTIYPRSISFEDIDKAVFDWFNTRNIVISKRDVPVFYLTPESGQSSNIVGHILTGITTLDSHISQLEELKHHDLVKIQ